MTQEEKDILIADLCGRLPYKVKCSTPYGIGVLDSIDMEHMDLTFEGPDDNYYTLDRNIKPYLRPLSSMTKSERKEFDDLCKFDEDVWMGNHKVGFPKNVRIMSKCIDWLNKNMFDYRGLIPKGLALEAKEGLYNN
jgi:hypothetical protein